MKIIKLPLICAAAFICSCAWAFDIDTEAVKNKRLFGIEFPDGTSFYASAPSVVSLSKQEFVAGPLVVTEICIEISGASSQLRIYHARPVKTSDVQDIPSEKLPDALKPYAKVPQSIQKQLEKANKYSENSDSQPKVYKDYPTTTHAHTLEFIMTNIDELEMFYNRLVADLTGKTIESGDNATAMPNIALGLGGKIYKIQGTTDASKSPEKKK